MNTSKYPVYSQKLTHHITKEQGKSSRRSWLIISSIVMVMLSITLLILTKWFIYVLAALVLAGLMTHVVRNSRLKWLKKILSFIGLIAIFLFVVDINSGDILWSIRYAGPSLINVSVVIVSLAILFKKKEWDDYVPIQLIILGISLSYIGLSFVLGIISASLALLFFGISWIRRGRDYNRVIARMMHI